MSEISSFRKVLAYAPQPNILLQVVGNKTVIEVANNAYLQLFGITEDNIVQKELFKTPNFRLTDFNASIALQLKASIQECIQWKKTITLTEQAFTVYQLLYNKIEPFIISFTITPIESTGDSDVTLVLISLTDDTEKITFKNTCALLNKQVQDSKSDIEDIENALQIGRWEIDVANNRLSWSDAVFTICGYAPQAFDPSKRQAFAITHPDDTKHSNEALNKTIKLGTPFYVQRRLIKADGEIIHVLSKGKAIKNEAGEVIKVTGFFQDITEQVLQNQAINTTKAQQEALINSTSDLIWLMDTQMDVLVANDAYFNEMNTYAIGYKSHKNEAIEKLNAARKLKWKSYLPEVLKGNSISFREKNLNPISNQYEHAFVTINPIKNKVGEIENIACFAKDITNETNNLVKREATNTRLENILAASLDMICTVNAMGVFLDVSAASKKILGYKPEEMIGKGIADFLHPEDVAATFEEIPKLINTGTLLNFENRYIKKNGGVVYIGWAASYQAKTNILYCIGRDITEKKQQELALQASQKEYQSLFDNNPSALIIWDFETKNIVECNAKALDLYGYTKAEFLQLSIKNLQTKEELENFENITKSEVAYINSSAYGSLHKKKNGNLFFIEASKHLIDYKGRRCALKMVNNITEKLTIQRAIAESEAKYRSFFENSLDAIMITNGNTDVGKIFDANPAACKLFKRDKTDLLATSRDVLYDTTDLRFKAFITNRNKSGYAKAEITCITRTGKRIEGELSSSRFKNADGEYRNLILIRDITERIENQERIRESNDRFNYVTKATSEAIWDWDLKTDNIFWGEGFETIFGYTKDEIVPTLEFRLQRIHPRDKERVMNGMYAVINGTATNWEDTYRFLKADGTYAQVNNKGFVIRDTNGKAIRMVGAIRDISQSQYYSELEKLERNILAINEDGDKTLEEILSIYLLGIEVLHPGMICSILQLKGNQLFNLATPSLSEDYTTAINGVVIGNNVGSCGTAAFTKKNVFVTDIDTDSRWADYKDLAAEFGLKACWTHPIFNQKDAVIATFAAYYQQKNRLQY